MRTLGFAVLALVLAACATQPGASPTVAPAPPPFFLDVANLDGPPVDVTINGRPVAHVVCQLAGAGGPKFTPGLSLPLPWTVTVVRAGGSSMGQWIETGSSGPRTILIRGDQAGEMASEDASGGPVPKGTCPP
jgi:hypothetical protein